MTSVLNLLLVTVIVGLADGQQLAVENPQFLGFIESRTDGAVLFYRQQNFHGELSISNIQRIDFGYRPGFPFMLTVTLRNGQKLEVQSERRNFVMLKGTTNVGLVTVKHPDPISTPLQIPAGRSNREDDLTIQYLEFPTT
jgi:hypothetical protein